MFFVSVEISVNTFVATYNNDDNTLSSYVWQLIMIPHDYYVIAVIMYDNNVRVILS